MLGGVLGVIPMFARSMKQKRYRMDTVGTIIQSIFRRSLDSASRSYTKAGSPLQICQWTWRAGTCRWGEKDVPVHAVLLRRARVDDRVFVLGPRRVFHVLRHPGGGRLATEKNWYYAVFCAGLLSSDAPVRIPGKKVRRNGPARAPRARNKAASFLF